MDYIKEANNIAATYKPRAAERENRISELVNKVNEAIAELNSEIVDYNGLVENVVAELTDITIEVERTNAVELTELRCLEVSIPDEIYEVDEIENPIDECGADTIGEALDEYIEVLESELKEEG